MYYKETPRNCRKQKEGERAPCRGSLDNPALSPATATITNKARRAAQTYNVPIHNCGVHNHHPHPHITPRRVRPVVPSAPPLPPSATCHPSTTTVPRPPHPIPPSPKHITTAPGPSQHPSFLHQVKRPSRSAREPTSRPTRLRASAAASFALYDPIVLSSRLFF